MKFYCYIIILFKCYSNEQLGTLTPTLAFSHKKKKKLLLLLIDKMDFNDIINLKKGQLLCYCCIDIVVT